MRREREGEAEMIDRSLLGAGERPGKCSADLCAHEMMRIESIRRQPIGAAFPIAEVMSHNPKMCDI